MSRTSLLTVSAGRCGTMAFVLALALAPLPASQGLQAQRVGAHPLHEAAKAGELHHVRALHEDGADVNEAAGDGMTALHWAAERGHADVTAYLISEGADVHAASRIGQHTPLHMAASRGRAEIVEQLLGAGADVGAVATSSGVTPLHLAAKAVHGEAIHALNRKPK